MHFKAGVCWQTGFFKIREAHAKTLFEFGDGLFSVVEFVLQLTCAAIRAELQNPIPVLNGKFDWC